MGLTVGTCLGGGVVGFVADHLGRRAALFVVWIVYMLSVLCCILEDTSIPYLVGSLPFAHPAALCLGLGNGSVQALLKSLVAANFPDQVKDMRLSRLLCAFPLSCCF